MYLIQVRVFAHAHTCHAQYYITHYTFTTTFVHTSCTYLQYTHVPCSCCQVNVWWVNYSCLLMMLCVSIDGATCACGHNGTSHALSMMYELELKLCTVVHLRLQNSWMYSVNSSALQINHLWLQLGVTQPWCSVFCDTATGCTAQKVMNLHSGKSHAKNTTLLCYPARKLAYTPIGTPARSHESLRYY